MSLDALIILSGVLIALLPFLGFPLKWYNVILVILGVVVIALGVVVILRRLIRSSPISTEDGTDVDNVPRAATEVHDQ